MPTTLGTAGRAVRAIVWHPFRSHWFASAGTENCRVTKGRTAFLTRFNETCRRHSGADTAVRVWDVRSMARPMRMLEGHEAAVLSVGQDHLEHEIGPVASLTAVRGSKFCVP